MSDPGFKLLQSFDKMIGLNLYMGEHSRGIELIPPLLMINPHCPDSQVGHAFYLQDRSRMS